jgi:hypothetical protein
MENSISSYILPILSLLTVWTAFIFVVVLPTINKIKLYFNPFNEYEWLDSNMYRTILFDDPYIKGRQNLKGKLEYIGPSKNKRSNKKLSYELGINIGGKNIMWIPITAKWEFENAKARP